MTVNSPSGSTLQCGSWLWDDIHPSLLAQSWRNNNTIKYSTNTVHAIEFAHTSVMLEFYICFRFRPYHRRRHVFLHQSAKFYPNRTSAILDLRGPIMGSLKCPCTTSYRSSIEIIALNCLVLGKIALLHFGDRQTNKQTNKQTNTWAGPSH